MVSLGLNISKISLGGLVVSTVIFIALRFLPKLYDSVSMIVFGINGKSYFINRKWYGFTYLINKIKVKNEEKSFVLCFVFYY